MGGKRGETPTLLSTLSLSSLSLVWFIFLLSFIPRPKSTRRPIDTRHSCARVQSTSEQIKQWGDDRLLTVSEGWRQWAADNVFSLWRQFASRVAMVRVDSSVLCQNMPTGWMCVCLCQCVCVCPHPVLPSCGAQNDFFIISASPFSRMTAWKRERERERWSYEKEKRDECGLMGKSLLNSICPPKQDVETPRCSLNIPAQSVPFVRQR